MTTDHTEPFSRDQENGLAAAVAAVDAALAKGPTDHEWVAVHEDDAHEVATIGRIGDFVVGVATPGYPGGNYRDTSFGSDEADAMLAAACSPVAIRSILAALKEAQTDVAAERARNGVLVGVLRECDQVISTMEADCTDEGDGLQSLLRSIKRLTMLRQADEIDLLSTNAARAAEEKS